MLHFRLVFVLLALAMVGTEAKPSHNYGFPGVFDHLDLVPPVFPPAHFHAAEPAPVLPFPTEHLHPHHAKFLPPLPFHAQPFLPAELPLLPAPAHLPLAAVLPAPAPLLPAPVPVLPAPVPVLPAPAPLLPAHAHLLPAPAPLLPAPLHVHHTPVVHTETHIVQAPAPVAAPVLDTLPVVEHAPTYRAIFGPKSTTHHVSLGYAFTSG